jgi:hypothetical protein
MKRSLTMMKIEPKARMVVLEAKSSSTRCVRQEQVLGPKSIRPLRAKTSSQASMMPLVDSSPTMMKKKTSAKTRKMKMKKVLRVLMLTMMKKMRAVIITFDDEKKQDDQVKLTL